MLELQTVCEDIAESTLEDGEIFFAIESKNIIPLIFSKEKTEKRRLADPHSDRIKDLYFHYGEDMGKTYDDGRPVARNLMIKNNGCDWHIQRTFQLQSTDDVEIGDKVVLNHTLWKGLEKGTMFTVIGKDNYPFRVLEVQDHNDREFNLYYWRFNKC